MTLPDALREDAPTLRLRLLGMPAWCDGGGRWHALARKDAVLLAALALNGAQSRSQTAAWLWPGVQLPRAHANLRQRLFRLRRQGGALVDESDDGLRLSVGVQCDVDQAGCQADADIAAQLLAGLDIEQADEPGDEDIQHWIDNARRQWAARRVDLLGGLASRHEAAGSLAAALATTEQLLALEPLFEHGWRRLMHLHVLRGDRAAALAAFERCERVLRHELGVKPSPETLALLHRVETLTAAQASASLPLLPTLLRPPCLVGREAERRAMAGAWQAGAAFLLLGEAGLGKSRLLNELAAAGPGRVLSAALPGDEDVPYAALVRLLRGLERVAPRPEQLWPQGAARGELARLLPELGPAPAAPGLQALLHGAVEQVFRTAPQAGVQAVLFDDLQHADEATRALLRRLAATPGLHWGLASRPEPRGGLDAWLASSSRLQPIVLASLGEPELEALLESLRLPALDPKALAPALTRHSGGNPFFVLETLRHLLLQGATARADGPLPLPPSVEAMLAQRLARLSAAALALAHVAAVAGADFSGELAADVLRVPLVELAAPWAELQRAQVLRDQPGTPALDAFAHEAVRDAVLRGLPQALRAPLHARVAASLSGSGAPALRVARHFEAANDLASAAPQALAAAAEALRLGRTAQRLAHLRQAAAWFDTSGNTAAAFDTRVASIEACLAHEGLAAAGALAQSLLPAAVTRTQRRALHLARAGVGLSGYDVGLTLHAAAAALAEADAGSDDELSARALLAAGRAQAGETEAALAEARALCAALPALRSPLLAAHLWGHCAVVFNSAGHTLECHGALQQQQRFAREAGHAEMEASALGSLSGQHTSLGDNERAIHTAQEAAVIHRRMQADHAAVVTEINLAIAYIGASRLRDALDLLDGALSWLRQSAGQSDTLLVVADLRAEVWLRVGQPQRALDELQGPDATELNLARRLNRLALRAQAAQMLGHGTAARAGWLELHGLTADGPGSVLRLRSRALASVALPAARAQAELATVQQLAAAMHFPAGEALARMRGAAWALRGGEVSAALADAQVLAAGVARARHLFVSECELRALVCRVFDAAGCSAEASTARADAARWLTQVVLPQLPAGCEADWRAHPAHQALWT